MANVLDRPRIRGASTDDDWNRREISTAGRIWKSEARSPTTMRRYQFSLLGAQLVVESEERLPEWFHATVASLDALGQLAENWDSYGARRVKHSSILATVELLLTLMRDNLPAPTCVPTNRGNVIFEWHTRGIDLEVEVLGPGRLHVAFENPREKTEWEADLTSDLTKLVQCVDELARAD